jgi:pyruvate-formate lyase-activating enzyme
VEEIIRLRPKLLLVTGGEPALLPELPEYLRRIKAEGGDPFIVLNTNLMIPAQSIGAVLPHADGFNVSIDSLGKGNILNRGVDGEKLFSRLEELWRTVETLDRTVLVTVFSVVTLHNYREIPEMIERIHRLSPKISVVITAMQPFEHPLSITSHADLLGPFLQSLQEMQKGRKELIIEIPNVVMNRANSGRELKVKSHIKCIRQYFRTEIPVLGENAYCKPTRFTHLFRQQAKEARAQRNSVRMWQIAYRAARSLLMPPHTTRCYFPCKCEMPIERIVRSRHANDPILNFLLFRGRFTDEDIKTATRFIHRFNPFFRASFLKQFRRDNASERSNRITPE